MNTEITKATRQSYGEKLAELGEKNKEKGWVMPALFSFRTKPAQNFCTSTYCGATGAKSGQKIGQNWAFLFLRIVVEKFFLVTFVIV